MSEKDNQELKIVYLNQLSFNSADAISRGWENLERMVSKVRENKALGLTKALVAEEMIKKTLIPLGEKLGQPGNYFLEAMETNNITHIKVADTVVPVTKREIKPGEEVVLVREKPNQQLSN